MQFSNTPLPWSDLKIAYDLPDFDPPYDWLEGRLPPGWEMVEAYHGSAIFRVTGPLHMRDAEQVARLIQNV